MMRMSAEEKKQARLIAKLMKEHERLRTDYRRKDHDVTCLMRVLLYDGFKDEKLAELRGANGKLLEAGTELEKFRSKYKWVTNVKGE